MEIKDDCWANVSDHRRKTDAQMRQRFDDMLHKFTIPQLYGLSLAGTSLRIIVQTRPQPTGKIPDSFATPMWIKFCRMISWRDSEMWTYCPKMEFWRILQIIMLRRSEVGFPNVLKRELLICYIICLLQTTT